jgi:tyrosine-protein phosphatase SIW14
MISTCASFSRRSAVLLFSACLAAAAASIGDAQNTGNIPSASPGLPNFRQVNDHVFRGGQPTSEGFAKLSKLGVKTVVDLREPGDRSRTEEKIVKAAGMQYVSVPMHGMETPSDANVSKVLSLLDNPSAGPVFVHCLRGADRTGAVIACYRINHDHWDNQKALAEARSDGMSIFERSIQRYVLRYQPLHDRPMSAPAVAGFAPLQAP